MPSAVRAITRVQDADDFSGSLTDTYIPAWSNSQQKFVMTAQPSTTPAGSNTQVQYNSSGAFAGHSGFVYDGAGKVTLSSALVSPAWRPASDSTTALQIQNASGTAFAYINTTDGNLGINITPVAHLDVKSASDSRIGAIVRANSATQSANLMEYRDYDNSVLSAVNRSGWGLGIAGSPSYKIDVREMTNVQIAKFAQGSASFPAVVQVDRNSTARAASVIYTTSGSTYNWFAGLAYRSGGTSNNYFVGTLSNFSPDSANAVLCLTTTGLAAIGQGTTIPTAYMDLAASTTTAASLRIRSGTAPTSPNDGDVWFDGTNYKCRIGGVTKTFTVT